MQKIICFINALNEYVGRATSWLTLAMVLITLSVVLLRYLFDIGFIWMQDLYIWMHGMLFMCGAAYTLKHDAHVRVDLIYANRGVKYKAWVNLLGSLFLLLPIIVVVFCKSWPYVTKSWQQTESSMQAGGLPGLYLLKSILIVFCVLMLLQTLSLILTSLLTLFDKGGDDPEIQEEHHVG